MTLTIVAGHDDLSDVPTPAERSTLLGRGAEWSELQSALTDGRLHHAWLFQGPEGIGKASTAYAFARRLIGGESVLLDQAHGEPRFRDDHPVFRQMAQGSHPNFLHIRRPPMDRGEGFRTQITVDEIRRLNHFFRSTAAETWRVALIDPVDDMNRNAANALLKILEEPPERSIFLIVNHMPGRLLPTIRSRARTLRFGPLSAEVVARALAASFPDQDAPTITAAAKLAQGSLRAAYHQIVSGGLEIMQDVEKVYGAARTDWRHVHALADALTQKGREEAWGLVRDGLFDRLASDARRALAAGDRKLAASLAEFWRSETGRWQEAAAFNLDRKQTLITFASGLAAVRETNR